MARLLIAGAGAAGLFAAGSALKAGHSVTLVEHMKAPGQKLAITGKGRCNLTNACEPREFFAGLRRGGRFLQSAVYSLPPIELMRLFEEELGLPLKTERGRRVFPQSDRAADVVEALLRRAQGAQRVKGRAAALLLREGRCAGLRLADGRELEADAVLVATGGLSYPVTGSTGDGYALAKQAGHSVAPPVPSLVALHTAGGEARQLAGLSLRNVRLTLLEEERPVFSEQGELLFTHFGVSGPLTLSASAFVEKLGEKRYTIEINLKPALDEATLDARLQRDFAALAGRTAAHSLNGLLPASLRPVMLARWGMDPAKKAAQITREERRQLGALLRAFRLEVTRRGDLEHAVVTAGGVALAEIDPKTMASRLCPGLYFAGEVLDADGYTGGYNLHIAWATGHAAAMHLPASAGG